MDLRVIFKEILSFSGVFEKKRFISRGALHGYESYRIIEIFREAKMKWWLMEKSISG